MSRNLWMIAAAAMMLWIAAILWPVVAFTLAAFGATSVESAVETHPPVNVLWTSVGWAAAVAMLSVALGWAPGRRLGASIGLGHARFTATAMLWPLCVPAYVVFYAWWQSWPPDSAVFRWIVGMTSVVTARQATLLLALVCWTWPLVAVCVATRGASHDADHADLLRLDGAPAMVRFAHALRRDGSALAMGLLLAFLATLNNTTCFDLAEVFTFANELRAAEATGATAPMLLRMAAPMMIACGIAAVVVWRMLGARSAQSPVRAAMPSRGVVSFAWVVWTVTFVLPIAMFAWRFIESPAARQTIATFIDLYVSGVVTSLALAVVSGALAAVLALGMAALWLHQSKRIRAMADVMGVTLLIAGLLPGTVLVSALHSAYNRPMFADSVYAQPVILNLAHLACFGFVAALTGRWLALAEPATIRDLRRLDTPLTLRAVMHTARPRLIGGGIALFTLVMVLSLGEVAVSARLTPPMPVGRSPLAGTLLNDMHYQRPQAVLLSALGLVVFGAMASGVLTVMWSLGSRARRIVITLLMIVAAGVVGTGCGGGSESGGAGGEAFDPVLTFGSPGAAPGQFNYPRGIAVDHANGVIYVVDKSARIQRFSLTGEAQAQWRLPEWGNGKPTGISVSPDGRVFVPDTHYYRIIAYDTDGTEQMRFGSYGTGPGQFTYTTDVAFGPEGRIYVSEYGGNDRVQVFDQTGTYLFEFGAFGTEIGQFNRPQSLSFNAAQTELFITDACNHRVVVTNPQGAVLRTLGSVGREIGQLCYPYGLTMESDEVIVVAEFGNNRVQRLDAHTGKSLGIIGTLGRGPGEVQYPWGVEAHDGRLYILDSGNNRVQVVEE